MAKKEKTKKDKKVVFFNKKSPDFRSIFVDSVWGAVYSPDIIKVNVCTERYIDPKKIIMLGHEEKERILSEEHKTHKDDVCVEREFQCELVITKQQTKSIVEWLNQKIKQMESQEKGKSPEKPTSTMYG